MGLKCESYRNLYNLLASITLPTKHPKNKFAPPDKSLFTSRLSRAPCHYILRKTIIETAMITSNGTIRFRNSVWSTWNLGRAEVIHVRARANEYHARNPLYYTATLHRFTFKEVWWLESSTERNCLVNFTKYHSNSLTDCPLTNFTMYYSNFL